MTSSASLSFLCPGPTNRKGSTANRLETCLVEALLAEGCDSDDCGARRGRNGGDRNRTTAAISAPKVATIRLTNHLPPRNARRLMGFRGLSTPGTWFRVPRRVWV